MTGTMVWENCIIKGGGHDVVGTFTWNGSYSSDKARVVKQYIGAHAVLYEGIRKGCIFQGHWSIGPNQKDSFLFTCEEQANSEKEIIKATEAARAKIVTRPSNSVLIHEIEKNASLIQSQYKSQYDWMCTKIVPSSVETISLKLGFDVIPFANLVSHLTAAVKHLVLEGAVEASGSFPDEIRSACSTVQFVVRTWRVFPVSSIQQNTNSGKLRASVVFLAICSLEGDEYKLSTCICGYDIPIPKNLDIKTLLQNSKGWAVYCGIGDYLKNKEFVATLSGE